MIEAVLRRPWLGRGSLIAAGAIGPFAFAPYEQSWVLLLSLLWLLFAWAYRRDTRVLDGWLFGIGYFAHGLSWLTVSIHVYGGGSLLFAWAAVFLAAAILSVFFAAPAWLSMRLSSTDDSVWLFVLLLSAFEWVRGHLFTGFPWLSFGYALEGSPMAGVLPIAGVYALGLLVLLTVAAVYSAVSARTRERRIVWLAVAIVPSMLGYIAGLPQWTQPSGDPLQVALIQGSHGQEMKWKAEQRDRILNDYQQLTSAHMDADLVVWPETAVTGYFDWVYPSKFDHLEQEAAKAGLTVLTGAITREPDHSAYYNAIVALGAQDTEYRKRHLVPFGEYFPLKPIVEPILSHLNIPMSAFSKGQGHHNQFVVKGQMLHPLICYEAVFGAETAAGLGAATFLLNISNDGWFGQSAAAYQHLQMVKTRVRELGRPLIRATNTGITIMISADGEEIARLPMYQRAVLRASVQGMSGNTPYQQLLDWPFLLVVVIGVSISVAHQKRKKA